MATGQRHVRAKELRESSDSRGGKGSARESEGNEAMGNMGTSSSKPPIYKMPSERKQNMEVCLSNIAAIDFGTTYCSLGYKTKRDSAGVTVVRLDSSVQRVPNAILLRVTGEHQVCSMCHCEQKICKSKGECASDYAKYKELKRTVDPTNSKALDMPPLTPRGLCCEVVSFGMQAQDEYIKLRESNYENHIFFERVKVKLITVCSSMIITTFIYYICISDTEPVPP